MFSGRAIREFQAVKVFWNEVSQIAVFGVRPNLLHRIEVWGVGRQGGEAERSRKPILEISSRGSMNAPSIPDHDQFPLQRSTQIDDESLDGVRLDVLATPALKTPHNLPNVNRVMIHSKGLCIDLGHRGTGPEIGLETRRARPHERNLDVALLLLG